MSALVSCVCACALAGGWCAGALSGIAPYLHPLRLERWQGTQEALSLPSVPTLAPADATARAEQVDSVVNILQGRIRDMTHMCQALASAAATGGAMGCTALVPSQLWEVKSADLTARTPMPQARSGAAPGSASSFVVVDTSPSRQVRSMTAYACTRAVASIARRVHAYISVKHEYILCGASSCLVCVWRLLNDTTGESLTPAQLSLHSR